MRSDYKELLAYEDNGVLTITFNRHDRLNVLSSTIKQEIMDCLREAQTDDSVKAIVLTGAGKAFCAGGDLNGFGGMDAVAAHQHMSQIGTIVSLITAMEKPIIAAVNGYATGAGCNLALACDIVFAAKSAKFCQSFRNVGLIPDGGGTYFLPRLIGPGKAKDLIFTGRMLTAEEAERMGLATFVVDDERLQSSVAEYARSLAAGPSVAIGMAKMLIHRSSQCSLDEMLEYERFAQALCMQTEDHQEGLLAFRQKRLPAFGSGKNE
ncbi:enoyl-CoA hydratase [Fodinisporobacter ferrooxydans]|uniref:Enoyl-CoA hydratase n=1 Tax=Fodinisporobacter ferrooxydans TaxID=2901836 RepID=A0ABY4CL28_9BACL|nr:enoyl-CoA hydratase [Alicyclobacillaceae bacterium MYW30-H2]